MIFEIFDAAVGPLVNLDYERAVLAMLLSTKPKWLSHKRLQIPPHFPRPQLLTSHGSAHPSTGHGHIARPPLLIESLTSIGEVSAKRPRPDEDEDTPGPAPKRRGMARSLRQCGPKGAQEEQVVAVPIGRIVASGKGWVEIEADDDI
ncbi:hypothetical protein C8F04DRAFT_1192331 [Mycena alexandri]|uniref:Uncharacterized protein n=1 Tax=Mycena alexandri TaxID=1745969 RepID=A0AAD6WRM1_9AGAR|nr:hypothetical protein C8F04DRAFT_1192331 [Mycena alexandri]